MRAATRAAHVSTARGGVGGPHVGIARCGDRMPEKGRAGGARQVAVDAIDAFPDPEVSAVDEDLRSADAGGDVRPAVGTGGEVPEEAEGEGVAENETVGQAAGDDDGAPLGAGGEEAVRNVGAEGEGLARRFVARVPAKPEAAATRGRRGQYACGPFVRRPRLIPLGDRIGSPQLVQRRSGPQRKGGQANPLRHDAESEDLRAFGTGGIAPDGLHGRLGGSQRRTADDAARVVEQPGRKAAEPQRGAQRGGCGRSGERQIGDDTEGGDVPAREERGVEGRLGGGGGTGGQGGPGDAGGAEKTPPSLRRKRGQPVGAEKALRRVEPGRDVGARVRGEKGAGDGSDVPGEVLRRDDAAFRGDHARRAAPARVSAHGVGTGSGRAAHAGEVPRQVESARRAVDAKLRDGAAGRHRESRALGDEGGGQGKEPAAGLGRREDETTRPAGQGRLRRNGVDREGRARGVGVEGRRAVERHTAPDGAPAARQESADRPYSNMARG